VRVRLATFPSLPPCVFFTHPLRKKPLPRDPATNSLSEGKTQPPPRQRSPEARAKGNNGCGNTEIGRVQTPLHFLSVPKLKSHTSCLFYISRGTTGSPRIIRLSLSLQLFFSDAGL
jgi:hypothetical protein